eukprot:CAMPEP_0114111466 /NCGR_PEP_ID=MMETSP0043_2-20121206/1869_1 /TAXON_ID=464988 /ORGANISM="Hemiselmis andersenii, Strain CCMP644" /LENGTH=255 /DNA_ID=CAMNT_0001203501 /DNA_START=85 /DNA_END=849 /DNA_ORIENTATION=+
MRLRGSVGCCLAVLLAASLPGRGSAGVGLGDTDYSDIEAEVKAVQERVGISGLEEAGVPFDGNIVASFVRSCSGDSECAISKAKAYLKFRAEKPHVYANLTLENEHMDWMANGGSRLLDGVSCGGHRVALIVNHKMRWTGGRLETLQMQAYNHEQLFRYQDAQRRGVVIVQDLWAFSMSQIWRVVRTGGLSLTNHYPQRIVKVIIVGEPSIFGKAWNIIRMILPQPLRSSVELLGRDYGRIPEVASGAADCKGEV